MDEHGQISKHPGWEHCRWCSTCNQHHGILYPCKHYSRKILGEIKQDSDTYVRNLNDPHWVKEQVSKGTPPTGISIMRFFAGLE